MKTLFNFMDWPLRAKMVALLIAVSLIPLGIAEWFDIRGARERLMTNTEDLLQARGDQLAEELDAFNRGYQRSVDRISRFPEVVKFCSSPPEQRRQLKQAIGEFLDVYPASDTNLRGTAILDTTGTVIAASERQLTGKNLSYHGYIKEALSGVAVISDIHYAEPGVGYAPTIAYVAPIFDPAGKMVGLASVWLRANSLWDVMKASNELAGPGSFAVLFDQYGIRIGHTYSRDIVFHPGGQLNAALVDALVAEQRFGDKTRALLEEVRAFPDQFQRSLSQTTDQRMFHGFAPVNQKWNYGVARRFSTVKWTVFYMIPEESLNAQIAQMTLWKTIFAVALILVAFITGTLFAFAILKPIQSLSKATEDISGGNLTARTQMLHNDELGYLGRSFNTMAAQIESQAKALQKTRDELEHRVEERTRELVQTTRNLEVEITEKIRAEQKLQAQLERLNLLHQITRAIGERQDMKSVFQAVIRSLEDQLPVDFCCVCLYDEAVNRLVITSVGVRSESLAIELAMTGQAYVDIDENGLSTCMKGQLVYEPDISQVQFPFPQRLTQGGLRSLVLAPLLVESKVFGILIAARLQLQGFSSGECEFLKQLSEHVALAAHQVELYRALQQAYDDLRQTQQAVMQQERLRALGQMASGIAHDINNAISPIALYAGSILENEPDLSARSRNYLKTIEHAIDDVAATVARMSEFYRQREQPLTLVPVKLNRLVQQVIDLTRARWSDMPQQRGIVIKMQTDLMPDLPPVMGVESEIREALTNLIFNAVDAMPEGGTLTIRTKYLEIIPGTEQEKPLQFVAIDVSDTGIGMDEDTRRRCLEPFFTTKGERGTGLGLAMVYGAVKRHSAEIEIESIIGKGTTIRLRFMVYTGVIETDQPETKYVASSHLHILIIDDDPIVLNSLHDILEADGHKVVSANSGQSGIDTFLSALGSKDRFDVVISDLGMPYVDGRKVAVAVKHASPSTPVIMLTGWGMRLTTEGDGLLHVDRVLSKPPKLRELREALAECTKQEDIAARNTK